MSSLEFLARGNPQRGERYLKLGVNSEVQSNLGNDSDNSSA